MDGNALIRVRDIRRWYRNANAQFFDNALPDLRVTFGDLPGTVLGRTHYRRKIGSREKYNPYKIIIDAILRKPCLEKELARVLLHEMAHVKLGVKISCEVDHGVFEKEMRRLVNVGAFHGLW